MTERRYDTAADGNAISPFLDRNFYGEMSCNMGITPTRIDDRALQYRGVDVKIEGMRGTSYIDEKVKLNNINNPPPNFCFELSSIQGAKQREGWLTHPESLTTHYLIGCVFSRNTDKKTLTETQVDHITASLISKTDVIVYLASLGLTVDYLRDFAAKFNRTCEIAGGVNGRIQRISVKDTDAVWMTCSHWLDERPLNIVIPSKTLNLLPHTRRYCISRGGYVEIGYPTSEDVLTARIIEMERRMGEIEERLANLEDSDVDKAI